MVDAPVGRADLTRMTVEVFALRDDLRQHLADVDADLENTDFASAFALRRRGQREVLQGTLDDLDHILAGLSLPS